MEEFSKARQKCSALISGILELVEDRVYTSEGGFEIDISAILMMIGKILNNLTGADNFSFDRQFVPHLFRLIQESLQMIDFTPPILFQTINLS